MRRLLYILGCILMLILGFLCVINVGDDGGMIAESIKALKDKD